MAIRKISRLQHRRGLKSDLPPKLHEGEFGWCLDTKELFIGNSDADYGNSQVLTQWTPNDRIITHAYQGVTGFPANSVRRPIGSKLDDFVSVRDYGAVGNGIADDWKALQDAIADRYGKAVSSGSSPLSGFVTVYVPAGTYRITKPISLYPYVRLQGEGCNRTRIFLDSDVIDCVAQTADNSGNTTINIGLNSSILPSYIDIIDIWLDQSQQLGDILRIDRASNVRLENVKLSGSRIYNSNLQVDTKAIVIRTLGNIFVPKNITVQNCDISGVAYALYVNDPVTNIKFNFNDIHHCQYGMILGSDPIQGGPSIIKVSNNHFSQIESHGLACFSTNPGVVSNCNSFHNVGIIENTIPVVFGPSSVLCASIGDQFIPSSNVMVDNQNPQFNIVVGPQYTDLTLSTPDMYGPITLLNNNSLIPVQTIISYDILKFNTIHIDYSISRGSSKQVGKLTILTNGTINTTVLQDEFTTLGDDLGVTFGFMFVSDKLVITYLTTDTGQDAFMKYREQKWLT